MIDTSKIDLARLSQSQKRELVAILDEMDRRRAKRDPIFFIEHYLYTFDPRPGAYPHHLPFKLYPYQKDYVLQTIDAIRNGYDIMDEKSRDMGASWLALAVRFYLWIFEPGYQSLLGSRKEEYVDSGDAKSLFWKLDYFIEHITDPEILPAYNRTYMKLVNEDNKNAITGESSNKNFSRGGRYSDVLFDELGFWPDARSSWTAAGDATHCRHAVTTPPNEPSFAKILRFSQKIKIRTWHWSLHPKKDAKWYEYEKSRRSEEEVLHEIDISWEYTAAGRPYPEIEKVPFGRYDYDPKMPLFLSMDLGLDAVSLGYWQPVQNSAWVTLIDAFESSDQIIEWYFPFIGLGDYVNTGQPCPIPECAGRKHEFAYTDEQMAFWELTQDWLPTIFFGDPSGNQRHVESGISPYAILRNHGIDVQVNDKENDWISRRDATKRQLPFIRANDTDRTRWWQECLKQSHYPKREENSQATSAISKPVHDWTSHHRTQTEFFSVNYKNDFDTSRATFVSPRAPEGKKLLTPYQGASDGRIETAGLDLAGILRNNGRANRDWRSN